MCKKQYIIKYRWNCCFKLTQLTKVKKDTTCSNNQPERRTCECRYYYAFVMVINGSKYQKK